jgi:hypothetical protein
MTNAATTATQPTTWIVEQVTDHGRPDHNGNRYNRHAVELYRTTDADELPTLRAKANSELGFGSSAWIEVRTA